MRSRSWPPASAVLLLRKGVGIFDKLAAENDVDTGMLFEVADRTLDYFAHPRGPHPD